MLVHGCSLQIYKGSSFMALITDNLYLILSTSELPRSLMHMEKDYHWDLHRAF